MSTWTNQPKSGSGASVTWATDLNTWVVELLTWAATAGASLWNNQSKN